MVQVCTMTFLEVTNLKKKLGKYNRRGWLGSGIRRDTGVGWGYSLYRCSLGFVITQISPVPASLSPGGHGGGGSHCSSGTGQRHAAPMHTPPTLARLLTLSPLGFLPHLIFNPPTPSFHVFGRALYQTSSSQCCCKSCQTKYYANENGLFCM